MHGSKFGPCIAWLYAFLVGLQQFVDIVEVRYIGSGGGHG